MKSPNALVFCCALVLDSASLAAPSSLEAFVGERLEDFQGEVGVYAKNLRTGAVYERQADDLLATASVFKVAVLIEIFRRAEAGELNLQDRHRVNRSGISSVVATGALRYLKDEPELSLLDLCRLMIVVSDDVAADVASPNRGGSGIGNRNRNRPF